MRGGSYLCHISDLRDRWRLVEGDKFGVGDYCEVAEHIESDVVVMTVQRAAPGGETARGWWRNGVGASRRRSQRCACSGL